MYLSPLLGRTTAAAAVLPRLTACGTTDVEETEPAAAAADSGPITVTDYRGEEITLDAPAERVVTLEWAQTENVEILGSSSFSRRGSVGWAASPGR